MWHTLYGSLNEYPILFLILYFTLNNCSRSQKVTESGENQQQIYDFLLAHYSNQVSSLHCF